tara:strand:- start:250 stop:723 length:474 start_codon:yes stop_codon:yes gene_type:complete
MVFRPLDICIIQNCVRPQCFHLNGTNCIFLRKEGSNYVVICPNELIMRSFEIKNNNIKLDKDKNIEFIPGGNYRKVETRTNGSALNIKDRIINCKKHITLNEETVIFYDVDGNLQSGSKNSKFGNIANDLWNDNSIMNIKHMKDDFVGVLKKVFFNQ